MFRQKADVDSHMRDVHKYRKEAELEMQRQQKEEDLVSNYIRADKLDEYESDSDFEPDIYEIYKYGLNSEEVLSFMKRFKIEDILYRMQECFSVETIIYLMENEAVSVEDVSSFLDEKASYDFHCDHCAGILSYFLDEGYAIKPEWVAMIIDENELVEHIKQKYTFTFDEVHGQRAQLMQQSDIHDEVDRKAFYVQVHKHFPDPEFEDPFSDPFIDFK